MAENRDRFRRHPGSEPLIANLATDVENLNEYIDNLCEYYSQQILSIQKKNTPHIAQWGLTTIAEKNLLQKLVDAQGWGGKP
jgi:hypothetical protein